MNISKKKFAIILAIVLFLGTGMGASSKTTTVVKEVPVEKVVEKKVTVEKNGEAWRELKAIDDEGFKLAVTNAELCSAGFYAIANGDLGTIEAVTTSVKKNNDKITTVAQARQRTLKALGY